MAAASGEGFRFLELRPVQAGEDAWDPNALLTAIAPTTLPPGDNEEKEKAVLRERGWRDPRGLFGYTKDSPYKDLCIYFDAEDTSSPVNVAASKAFRCYGLDGAQGGINWEAIRGPCVVLRCEPPSVWSSATGVSERLDVPYNPLITPQELVDSLLFFKDRDAHQVAVQRDATRMFGDLPPDHPFFADPHGTYFSPAGSRSAAQIGGHDARKCAACAKPNTLVCSLKRCTRCKAAWYCDQDCQRRHFPQHNQQCVSPPAPAAP